MKMKENEPLNDYSSRLTDLINQMKSYGDEIEDQRVVEKILISILEIFDPIIEIIENTKDLKTLGIQELLSSLKSYEHRMTRHSDKAIESAFQSILQANVETSDTWFLDSGCSNHITGDESILVDIDTARNSQVKMGNGAVVQVKGKGMFPIKMKTGKGCSIYNKGINKELMQKIIMGRNRSFPIIFRYEEHTALKATTTDEALLWHRRLGHLNFQSLNLLHQKNMVGGLPQIHEIEGVCEGLCTQKASSETISERSLLESKEITRASTHQFLWSNEESISW
ncbi:retrovirus-related pol polyprotein from transposon TNT 1-94 [Tanacetum coccineum]|uniref:Retrovirus-related pol polyprotein from transposon TNT 1-94 n=1 Tax=Tanacetum coccineum TaxID=301880 RepID=A0ABQ5B4C1_9ASTR